MKSVSYALTIIDKWLSCVARAVIMFVVRPTNWLILGKFDLKDGAGYIGVAPSNPSTTRLPIMSSIMDQTMQWLGTTMGSPKSGNHQTLLGFNSLRSQSISVQFSKYLLNYFFEKLENPFYKCPLHFYISLLTPSFLNHNIILLINS